MVGLHRIAAAALDSAVEVWGPALVEDSDVEEVGCGGSNAVVAAAVAAAGGRCGPPGCGGSRSACSRSRREDRTDGRVGAAFLEERKFG